MTFEFETIERKLPLSFVEAKNIPIFLDIEILHYKIRIQMLFAILN